MTQSEACGREMQSGLLESTHCDLRVERCSGKARRVRKDVREISGNGG